VRKVSVIASASGSGKTTAGHELARRLGVPFVELDALVHGPNWTETPDDELRSLLEPVLAGDGWVIDGGYWGKIGDLVLAQADVVVWIDLPIRVWLPRLARRTVRRLRGHEEIWNGNRETVRGAVWGRDALIPYALRAHFRHRRHDPVRLARCRVVRLTSQAAVDAFVGGAGP
jgi:adenylate kinase family enzyme